MIVPIKSSALVTVIALAAFLPADESAKTAAERGAKAVRGHPAMNPPLWSAKAYDNLWKQWGLAERPADYPCLARDRYGLHPAQYDNGGLPMGLHYSTGFLGKGIVNDCLMCHAGVVAGQTIMGAPNASLDVQTLFDDLALLEKLPYKVPVQLAYTRGTVDPVYPVAFLMEFRHPDLRLRDELIKLPYTENVASDPPAWWLLKRKQTRNWTGGVKVNATRIDMVKLLTPLNDADHIKKHESTFADIHQFILTVESPKFPFPIDAALAERGRPIFNEHFARCHGTYGPDGKYPNKVVPLETIGTDATLSKSLSKRAMDYFNESWFAQEKAPDGSVYKVEHMPGYQAPPLDGVWATAPYLHNSAAPTIYHVLNSKARPKYWTRTYGTAKDDYDPEHLGWKTTALDTPPDPKLPAHERRRIYDTTQPGRSNAGHPFGDELTEEQRRLVIEYLKTL